MLVYVVYVSGFRIFKPFVWFYPNQIKQKKQQLTAVEQNNNYSSAKVMVRLRLLQFNNDVQQYVYYIFHTCKFLLNLNISYLFVIDS